LEEGSLTRGQALERFGIDLGRVGVMTSARTASRQSLEGVRAAADFARGTGRTGSKDEKNNHTGNKRGRGLSTGDSSKASTKAVVSDRLKLLDMFLSDEDRLFPTEKDEKNDEEELPASAELKEGSHLRVSKGKGPRNNTAADLPTGGGDMGVVEGRLRFSKMNETQSTLIEKKSAGRCQEAQVPVPEPRRMLTATDVPHGEQAGGAAGCSVKEVGEITLRETAPAKEATNICEKALPNHR